MDVPYKEEIELLCNRYGVTCDLLHKTIFNKLSNAHYIGDRESVYKLLYDYYLMMFYIGDANNDDSLYYRLYLNGLFEYRHLEYSLANIPKLIKKFG